MLWRLSRRDLRRFTSFFSLSLFSLEDILFQQPKKRGLSFLSLGSASRLDLENLAPWTRWNCSYSVEKNTAACLLECQLTITERQDRQTRELLLLLSRYMMLTKKYWKETRQRQNKKWTQHDKMADLMLFLLSDNSSCFDNRMQRYSTISLIYTHRKNPLQNKKQWQNKINELSELFSHLAS